MWPDRRLCDLFDIEHPIIQAPMALTDTPALASAVSNAGGLGSLGCGEMAPAEISRAISNIRLGTNRPFNVNFFIGDGLQTDPATLAATRERLRPWYERLGLGEPPLALGDGCTGFDDARLALALDLRPRVMSFHFGVPQPAAIAALKSAGIVLMSTATHVAEARALEAAGMDAIIAQGWEAGGHRGSHRPAAPMDGVGTMALVPQIVDAVSLPVIAAGGIGDGRAIAAALALGAAGVQMGTAFLRCPEAATDAAWRARLRDATDRDTMVTDAISGRCARVLRSRYAEAMERHRQPLPAFIQMYALSMPIIDAADDDDASFHIFGQAAALAREQGAAATIDRLVRETGSVLDRLARR